MHTPLSPRNPFGYDRYGFLWQTLSNSAPGRHLDFGAFDGAVIRELILSGVVTTAVGVEVNSKIVDEHSSRMPEGSRLQHIEAGARLPFEDDTFDTASLLDVIEHIADQQSVLSEVCRVLRPHGTVVVTVPRRHIFSVLDLGNLKFRFPAAHRRYYTRRHSPSEYADRYERSTDGLIGDIEAEKGWHQHFSEPELQALLEDAGYAGCRFDGAGLFRRPISLLSLATPRRFRGMWARPIAADARIFSKCHLFCTAKVSER